MVLVLLTAMALAVGLLSPPPVTEAGEDLQVIVTAADGLAATAADVVRDVGGSVGNELDLIGSVSATVPATALDTLRAEPAVASAVVDAPLQLTTAGWDDATKVNFNPSTYEGTVNRVGGAILQVDAYWTKGYDGSGVDVALIDSGVAPVNGLTYPGKIINGPDLSFESQSDDFRYLDTFGHGRHMAGIIAGRDDGARTEDNLAFLGVAPGSRIVSVKVADEGGPTDVSQAVAAIDWVVQHKNDDGLNIRVINLSFGTDSTQSYQLDPLAYAVEQAWKAGIVVVVAAGNDGNDAALRNPAADRFVIAVGATNAASTRPKITSVMDFSNCATSDRFVDVVVPGQSIASLRVPGSNCRRQQSAVGCR